MTDAPMNNLKQRPPIVVVMGHVDHGKTTLLDYIRKSKVAEREAGGITQSIGAYEIAYTPTNTDKTRTDAEKIPRESALTDGRKITFVDTPGHEAFSKMRSRGAHVADLAILVVAADEGVKPQTLEAVEILNETKTPFVVALTKTDKPGADLEKVKNELAANNVFLEGRGGQVSWQPVSAKTGDGVNELLELLLLAANLENLTYDPLAVASGFVLETKIDPRRGQEISVIVKNGTLRQGDPVMTASASGKIKILENFLGGAEKTLVPSAPAAIFGFEKLPQVGEEFFAGAIAETETFLHPEIQPSALPQKKEAQLPTAAAAKKELVLCLILKAADAGSLEALSEIIKNTANAARLEILDESVGDVTENDVKLAISSGAAVIGFKSRVHKTAQTLAENNRIRIITSEIIYELLRAVEKFLAESANPPPAGELDVLAVFNDKKLDKQLIGGRVASGFVKNKTQFQLKRGEEILGQGRILSLQQNKKEAVQVPAGNECGLLVSAPVAIQAGDKLVLSNKQ